MLSEKDDIQYRMDAKKDAYIDKNIAFVLDTIFEKGFKFQVDGKDFVLAGTSWNGKYEPKQVIGTTMKIFKVGVELTILEGTELGIVGKTDASCLSRRKKIYNMFNTLLGYTQGTLKTLMITICLHNFSQLKRKRLLLSNTIKVAVMQFLKYLNISDIDDINKLLKTNDDGGDEQSSYEDNLSAHEKLTNKCNDLLIN